MIELAAGLGIPWLIEFLRTSTRGAPASIWVWEESRSALERCHAATVVFHRCTCAAPCAKPTRLAGTWPNLGRLGYVGWPNVDAQGRCRGPLPRHCRHDHPPLIGLDDAGDFKTSPTADLTDFSRPSGHKPARGEPGPGTKSFTTGAYSVRGGLAGLRHNTREFSEVTAMLCRYIASLQPPRLSPIRT